MKNIYGVQKVEEINPRGKKDVAMGTGAMALQGAQMGSTFGPWGTAIGAVAGGAAGFIKGSEARNKEKMIRQSQDKYNDFVDGLSQRDVRSQNRVPGQDYYIPQAKYGMKNNRYSMAEIEGDGTGPGGAGEIVTDKNYNIKHVASGAPKHEEGGKKVPLAEGDIVFPTQNNKDKERQILSAVQRYKLNGDPNAKKYLDSEKDKLPEDKSKGEYPDGTKHFLEMDGIPRNDFDDVDEFNLNSDPEVNLSSSIAWDTFEMIDDPSDVTSSPQAINTGASITNGQNNPWDILFNKEKKWEPGELQEYARKNNLNWNDINSEADRRGVEVGDIGKGNSNNINNWGPLTAEYFSAEDKPAPAQHSPAARTNQPTIVDPGQIEERTYYAPGVEEAEDLEAGFNLDDTEGYRDTNHINPMKYASSAYNTMKGLEPAEQVTRRNFYQEPYDYKDLSHSQRSAVQENRNYMANLADNRVDRMGSLGTLGQISAQHLRQMEGINENEANREFQVNNMNTDLRNRSNSVNFDWANRYDEMDAMNRAAKERYLGTATTEMAELGQVNEQKKYMQDRNRKQYEMDQKTLGIMGTNNFQYNPNGWWEGPQYKR